MTAFEILGEGEPGGMFSSLALLGQPPGAAEKKKKNGLHASIQLTKIKILKFSRSQ